MTKRTSFLEKTEKRSITVNGRKTSLTIRPSVWSRFVKLCKENGSNTQKELNLIAMATNGQDFVRGIEHYCELHSKEPLYQFDTREKWLGTIVDAMRPIFEERGFPLPEKIRVAIGFTSTGWRGKRRGECWPRAMSSDGIAQIFIDPTVVGEEMLANILTHELCHAVDDCKSKHGKAFKRCGEAMNLEGPAKHMLGGDAWRAWAKPILEAVGPIPHGPLASHVAKQKEEKQSTRMLKCECPACGFTFRTTAKWLEGKDFLICPDSACGETIHFDA